MKNLMRLLVIVSLVITAGSAWGVTIDDFNYADQAALQSAYTTTFTGASGDCSVTLELSTVDKVEGSGAMKVSLSYATSQIWQYVYMTKDLSTSIDLSNAKRFSIWIKGDSNLQKDDPTLDAKCVLVSSIYGSTGYPIRYVNWSGSEFTTSSWHKASWTITDSGVEENPWSGYGGKPNLTNIQKLDLAIEINEYSPNSTILYFDDFECYEASSLVNEEIFDDFEGYANDSELQAAWAALPASAADTITIQLSTAEKQVGAKAMNANLFINDYWANSRIYKQTATSRDLSNARFVKFWLKGDDTTIPNKVDEWNAFFIYVTDTAGSWARATLQDAVNETAWNCYYAELAVLKYNYPGWGIVGPFDEEYWDPAGSASVTDLTAVNGIGFTYNLNRASNPTAPFTFNLFFDDISFLASTTNDLVADTYAINAPPSGTPVTVNVSGGLAPYTWTLSAPSLGTLSASSGASVTFTPAAAEAFGTLTITDSDDQSVVIPVAVTPTSAPLARDWALME